MGIARVSPIIKANLSNIFYYMYIISSIFVYNTLARSHNIVIQSSLESLSGV